MKKTASYEINHPAATIYVSKTFAKEASILNTPEYQTMLAVRRDNPMYKIEMREIAKKANKNSYRNLTIDNVDTFIRNSVEDKRSVDERIAEFERVKALSKAQTSPYAYVKRWFLKEYGDEYNRYQKKTDDQKPVSERLQNNVLSFQNA